MFGDLMGNLEQQQAEMQQKLLQIPVEIKMEGVIITGNAARQVTNVSVDDSLIVAQNKEMLEDMILEAINRFIEQATIMEAKETKNLMSDMLPPGFENLFK
jgi:DNA-binding protein YbaB